MSQQHDPSKQENYLRQTLSQDKMTIALLFGAGCPLSVRSSSDTTAPPLIPDIEGITKEVYRLSEADKKHKKNFKTVSAGLERSDGHKPNVEKLLTQIRLLKAAAGKEKVWGLDADELVALDDFVCEIIIDLTNKSLPDGNTPYHKVASWIGTRRRHKSVELFTTNYDLLMEQALEERRVPYFDGFVGSHRTFFDPHAMEEDLLPARWARIWKLHGSINWRKNEHGIVSRGEIHPEGQRRVIHPSHLKYDESRKMPYLAMMDRLHAFFKNPGPVLISCGYSFRDEHLNWTLMQGLHGNSTAILFGLLFGKLSDYPQAIELATSRPNLTLLADDGAVIGARQAEWVVKPKEAAPPPSIAVEWNNKNDHDVQGQFFLGNFVKFGSFLEDLIGNEQDDGGTAHER
jgi:hypothetical protein